MNPPQIGDPFLLQKVNLAAAHRLILQQKIAADLPACGRLVPAKRHVRRLAPYQRGGIIHVFMLDLKALFQQQPVNVIAALNSFPCRA